MLILAANHVKQIASRHRSTIWSQYELRIANGKDEGAGMWTIFLFIPILNYFAAWHYSSEYTAFATENYPALLLFVAWLVFLPIVWLLVQTDLNKAAEGGAA